MTTYLLLWSLALSPPLQLVPMPSARICEAAGRIAGEVLRTRMWGCLRVGKEK